jgi:hypothetical protein
MKYLTNELDILNILLIFKRVIVHYVLKPNIKERFQNVVFPGGLVLNAKNQTCLAIILNTIFRYTICFFEARDMAVKKLSGKNTGELSTIAGSANLSSLIQELIRELQLSFPVIRAFCNIQC